MPTGILQEATGLSLSRTVHEPQTPSLQPHFTEVYDKLLRTFIKDSSGRASIIVLLPFKNTEMFILYSPDFFLLLNYQPAYAPKADCLFREAPLKFLFLL